MKRFYSHFIASLLIISIFVLPQIIFAAGSPAENGGLIQCPDGDCTFNNLIDLVKAVINQLIIYSTLITTGVLAYAGFKLMTSGGNPKAKEDAKAMLTKVIWGYVWILIAWLVVYTITSTLLRDPSYYSLLGKPN